MKTLQRILLIDTVAQGILISATFLPALASLPLREPGIVIYSMIGAFFLGCWQVLSGIIMKAAFHLPQRGRYLGAVVLYFSVLALANMFGSAPGRPDLVSAASYTLAIVPPAVMALWYFIRTAKDLSVAMHQPRSFWDLQ